MLSKNVWFFQPDRVMEFCNNNDLQLIVRAHECVMDGFERFAQGHLITLFSATNYCGVFLGSSYFMWIFKLLIISVSCSALVLVAFDRYRK